VRRGLWRIWIACALVYLFFVGGYFNNTMANSIGCLTIALVDDGSLQIDRYAPYPNDVSSHEGHFYSGMPPGLSFALTPVYLAMKPLLALLPTAALERADDFIFKKSMQQLHPEFSYRRSEKRAALSLLLVFGVALLAIPLTLWSGGLFVDAVGELFPQMPGRWLLPSLLFLLLGTPLGEFTSTLFHTTLGAILIWVGFYGLLLSKNPGRGLLLLAGFALGAAFAVDYPALLYAAAIIAVYAFARRPGVAWVLLGALFPVAATLGYHWAAFGTPWTTAYSWRVIPLGITATSSMPGFGNLLRTLFDGRCSVLLYNPVAPAGLIAAIALARRPSSRRPLWVALAGVIALNLAYFTALPAHINPSGGSFGARYTVYSTLPGLLALYPWLVQLGERSAAALRTLLCAVSLPALMYFFYGSPNLDLGQYLRNISEFGPAGYTLYKAEQAGMARPWEAWLCTGFLALLCGWIVRSAVGNAHAHARNRGN
jgi:hypothetical protein